MDSHAIFGGATASNWINHQDFGNCETTALFIMSSNFRPAEMRQDLVLGVAFLLITGFSSIRIIRNFSPTGGRKVITTFNILIFIVSAVRAVWFLIPNNFLETSYAPQPLVAFRDEGWVGTLISELMLVTGSLSLYGIFILVACYWVNMLQKLNTNVAPSARSGFARFKVSNFGTMETFGIIMSVFIFCQGINICLFLSGVFNSEQMILYDSIMLSAVSVAVIAEITILSNQIQNVLQNLEAINNRNSQPQIRRIFAIIVVANVFFISRVILECTLAVCLVQLMRENHSFSVLLNDKYWATYILVKHLCEIVVLTLELIISTAIKSYDARAAEGSGATLRATGSGGFGGSASATHAVRNGLASSGQGRSYGATDAVDGGSEHGATEISPMLSSQRPYARAGPNDV